MSAVKSDGRVKLIAIGTVVNVIVIIATVLVTTYFGNFETKAESTAQDVVLEGMIKEESSERKKDVALVKNDIKYIKEGIKEIKEMLKK